ncbi:hypothetical protein ACOSP7_015410 [Xanthoceras sorbifolium]
MDIRNWCSSGSRTVGLSGCYNEIRPVSSQSHTGPNKLRWKVLWLKLKKEKRKMFESAAPSQVVYDPYTYSQNFDQGFTWDEPDNVSRSFSVRFANPSKLFLKKSVLS